MHIRPYTYTVCYTYKAVLYWKTHVWFPSKKKKMFGLFVVVGSRGKSLNDRIYIMHTFGQKQQEKADEMNRLASVGLSLQ